MPAIAEPEVGRVFRRRGAGRDQLEGLVIEPGEEPNSSEQIEAEAASGRKCWGRLTRPSLAAAAATPERKVSSEPIHPL